MKMEHYDKSVFSFYQIYVYSKIVSVQCVNAINVITCMHETVLLSPRWSSSPGAHLGLGVHKPNFGLAFCPPRNCSQIPIYYKAIH